MFNVESLTETDYKIFEYINSLGRASKTQLMDRFSSEVDAFEHRLYQLSTEMGCANLTRDEYPIEESNYIEEEFDSLESEDSSWMSVPREIYVSKDFFHLSNNGKIALQDYNNRKYNDMKTLEKEDKRYKISIFIAVVTFLTAFASLVLQVLSR